MARAEVAASVRMGVEVHPHRGRPVSARAANPDWSS